MLIHIVNETGIDYQTKVYDEKGKEIEGISAITISPMTPKRTYIQATLEFYNAALDIVAQVEFKTTCPHCDGVIRGKPKREGIEKLPDM